MKTEAKIIYDLAVIGNGIAAQSFLWNLSLLKGTQDRKSQNFSLAHIYSNEIAPACTLRSSATVSLNGIEEDVSQLGNDMREAFFLFDDMVKKFRPAGVEEVMRTVVSTNENDTKKLTRRYKTLVEVKHPRIKNIYPGAEYSSYIITPEVFTEWMNGQITIQKTDYPFFVRDMEKEGEHFKLKLQNGDLVHAKKIVFAIGAFAKIFERFFAPPEAESIEVKNTIKAGSYLERDIHLGDQSFYLSIDGNQVLYRKNSHEEKLIIGSITTIGAYESPDVEGLVKLHAKLRPLLTFDPGEFSDFKITTGLRHKGPKRLLILNSVDDEEKIWRINGLYKNGYTLSFLGAKRLCERLF